MNHLKALRRKLQKKKSKFIAEHEFKSADDLLLSQEDLDTSVEHNKIITVMLHRKLQFPAFQFNAEGEVYPALQKHLPRLLEARSNWDICFWIFTVQSITLKRAIPNAAMLRGISIEEMLELGKQAAEQTERYAGKPIDAATSGNSEVFAACVEHLLNPDYRVIPHS
ncbi:hypothetical protein [Photobacterium sanguinicancri]|uniref:hypothetical protein n=1 Tax=Photobacterium sanguinicancri TaxID=875932 RepID=UPI000788E6DA|nr:hypothetical protein [Photobacterium sanguinicancri]KXI21087.1 hypothetical protein AS132_20640 [Photobacterium sanguinicancri]